MIAILLLCALLLAAPAEAARRPIAAAATTTGIVYRTIDGQTLRLDACVPTGAGPFPAVVLVHGGGWTGGSRADLAAQCARAASEDGMAAFTIDYRLAPAALAPAPVDDLRAALAWIRANAATYRADPARAYCLGASAGGHLCLRVATGSPSEVRAVASWSGPTDLTDLDGDEPGDYLGCDPDACPSLAASESPLLQVTASTRPVFLAHSRGDRLVPFGQATDLEAALRAAGVAVGTRYVIGFAHGVQLDGRAWDPSISFLKAH